MRRFLPILLFCCSAVWAASAGAQSPPTEPRVALGYVSRWISGSGEHYLGFETAHPESVAVVFRSMLTGEWRPVVYRGDRVFLSKGPSGHYFWGNPQAGALPTMLGYVVRLYPNPGAGDPRHRVNASVPDSSNVDVEYNPNQWRFDRVELGPLVARNPDGSLVQMAWLSPRETPFGDAQADLLMNAAGYLPDLTPYTTGEPRRVDFDDQTPPPPPPVVAASSTPVDLVSVMQYSRYVNLLYGSTPTLEGFLSQRGILRFDFEDKLNQISPGPPVDFAPTGRIRIDFEPAP